MDRLESELKERLIVVRLNIQDRQNKNLVDQYRVRGTPTFILLNTRGEEIYRMVGTLDAEDIVQLYHAP